MNELIDRAEARVERARKRVERLERKQFSTGRVVGVIGREWTVGDLPPSAFRQVGLIRARGLYELAVENLKFVRASLKGGGPGE